MLTDCSALTESLGGHHVLEDAALHQTVRDLVPQYEDPKQLAEELVRRGWLTDFQKELILAGRVSELVLNSYILLDKIGEGGMGAVYKARHRVLKAVRAIKVIRPDRLAGKGAVERFYREAQVVAKLHHPNIILAHDAGESNGVHYFVMEFAPGADLGQLLQRCGPLPFADACAYIRQAAIGLEHARERGLIHRDIKPSNLLVTPDGQVKLLDLGLARVCAAEADEAESGVPLTQDGAVMGTPDYMAPEQAEDSRKVDIRADIYSLGCTLYHILAGRPPYPGGSVMEKLIKHRLEEPRPLEALRAGLPAGLAPVVRKMMAKSADSRYQTPAEVAAALEPFSGGAGRPDLTHPAELAGTLLPDVIPGLAEALAAGPTVLPGEALQHTDAGINSADALTATAAALPSRGSTEQLPPTGLEQTQLPFAAKAAPTGRVPTGLQATQMLSEASPESTLKTAEILPERPKKRGKGRLIAAAVVLVALGAGGTFFVVSRLAPQRQDTDDRRVEKTPVAPVTPPADTKPAKAADVAADLGKDGTPEKGGPARPPEKAPVETVPAGPPARAVARAFAGDRNDLTLARLRGPAVRTGGRGLTWARRQELVNFMQYKGRQAAFSADANRTIVGTTTDSVLTYNLRDVRDSFVTSLPELTQNLTDGLSHVNAVALSPDGSRMLMATVGRSARPLDGNNANAKFNMVVSWDTAGMTDLVYGSLIESAAGIRCMAFSPEGKEVLVGGALSQIYRWRPGTDKVRLGRSYFKHGPGDVEVRALAYSADGRLAASAGADRQVCVFDATKADVAPLTTLGGMHSALVSVALSPSGHYALAGSRDGKAILWELGEDPAKEIAKPARVLEWHDKDTAVTALTFVPSDRRLFVTGGEDGTLCLGDVGKDQPLWTEPSRGGGAIRALTVTADGRSVLVADEAGIGVYPVVRDVTALAKPAPAGPDAEVPPAEARRQ